MCIIVLNTVVPRNSLTSVTVDFYLEKFVLVFVGLPRILSETLTSLGRLLLKHGANDLVLVPKDQEENQLLLCLDVCSPYENGFLFQALISAPLPTLLSDFHIQEESSESIKI
ncbi:hypothetical protein AVEN_96037-1 [Araneus ventricosus]|uniref:Uncharacterized protein n=1 Tax=Araneus ventricosus TaxID=182803 RepID=A0A4Y2B373_ARAVE|nr:hypothetical protein AVEN_96037-1 [Araneus ventricosus]